MDSAGLGRWLIAFGVILLVVGIVLTLGPKIPLLGRLPGDFLIRRDGFTLFVPIATMIIVSLVLTVLLNIVFRIFR